MKSIAQHLGEYTAHKVTQLEPNFV